MDTENISLYNRLGRFCMAIQIFIALLGLLSYVPRMRLLGSVHPDYIPMAPSTAVFFLLLGLMIIFSDKLNRLVPILMAMVFSAFVVFFGTSISIQYLLGQKESFEAHFIGVSEKLGNIPVGIMSPATGMVFVFAGLSIFFILFNKLTKKTKIFAHLAGICASIVFACGAIFVLGYLYNQPFLYGNGSLVPMALTTAITFCFLGLGQMFFVSYAYPLVLLVGTDERKMLARQILPPSIIVLIIFMVRDIISEYFNFNINDALLISTLTIISVCIVLLTIVRTSNVVNSALEKLSRFPSESPYPVIRVNDHGIIIYANKASQEILTFWGTDIASLVPENWNKSVITSLKNNTLLYKEIATYNKTFSITITPIADKAYVNLYATDITINKKAESKILKSKQLSESIINSIPGIFYVFDNKGKFLRVNDNFLKISEYSLEEVLNMHPRDFFKTDEKNKIEDKIKEVFDKGESSVEADFLSKNGTTTPYYFTGYHTMIDNISVLVGMGIDIAERKKTEQALKDSEVRLKTIFNNANDGILLADAETKKFSVCNKMICQMLGYTEEELLRLSVYDIHPKEDLPRIIESFENQAVGKAIKTVENDLPVKRKDGSIFYADIHISPIDLSNRKYLMGIFCDVTELRKLEQIKKSKEFAELILRLSPNAIFSVDEHRRVTSWNKRAEEITGYTAAEIMGKECTLFSSILCHGPCILFSDNSKLPIQGDEFTLISKDKRVLIIRRNADLLRDNAGNFIGAVENFEDITETKKLKEKLIQSEKLAVLGKLAGFMAHEIRNPLAVITNA